MDSMHMHMHGQVLLRGVEAGRGYEQAHGDAHCQRSSRPAAKQLGMHLSQVQLPMREGGAHVRCF